ncbi:MAG: hypothetical protein ABJD07_11995 [Gemmatimonadaceae bacterium]
MPAVDSACKQCGGAMDEGFAAVSHNGGTTPLLWVAGELERDWFRGAKVDGRERTPIRVLRCAQCGHVAMIAPRPG